MLICLLKKEKNTWSKVISNPSNVIKSIEDSLLQICEKCPETDETQQKFSTELGSLILFKIIKQSFLLIMVLDPGQNAKDILPKFEETSKSIISIMDKNPNIEEIMKNETKSEIFDKISKEMELLKRFSSDLKLKSNIANALIIGLDRSGKTSFIQRIKTGQFHEKMVPTLGQAMVDCKIMHEGSEKVIKFIDMPGQLKLRYTWMKTVIKPNILLYMIDITDSERFEESKTEFIGFAAKHFDKSAPDPIPKDTYMQVLLNKVDLLENGDRELSKRIEQIKKLFKFEEYWNTFEIIPISTKTGQGIDVSIKKIIERFV